MIKNQIVKYKDENYDWDTIVTYMDDEIREKVHFDLAPCSNEEFLKQYMECDRTFTNVIQKELYPIKC